MCKLYCKHVRWNLFTNHDGLERSLLGSKPRQKHRDLQQRLRDANGDQVLSLLQQPRTLLFGDGVGLPQQIVSWATLLIALAHGFEVITDPDRTQSWVGGAAVSARRSYFRHHTSPDSTARCSVTCDFFGGLCFLCRCSWIRVYVNPQVSMVKLEDSPDLGCRLLWLGLWARYSSEFHGSTPTHPNLY